MINLVSLFFSLDVQMLITKFFEMINGKTISLEQNFIDILWYFILHDISKLMNNIRTITLFLKWVLSRLVNWLPN